MVLQEQKQSESKVCAWEKENFILRKQLENEKQINISNQQLIGDITRSNLALQKDCIEVVQNLKGLFFVTLFNCVHYF